jgi:pyruvate dehydrogenase E1 component alpha subunit
VTEDELLDAYEAMRVIRRFEESVVTLVNDNEIAGVTHEYVGQEAVAVGICGVLGADDVLTSTHRGHGHLIARGTSVGGMFAELMGRIGGVNKGRGGSMHAADVSLGIFGANGMVGAGAPWAAGAAATPLPDGSRRVAVAFFGDGALNQGVLLETMNLAAAWKLPVIFACENNGYAVSTSAASTTAGSPTSRAAGFGIPAREVDGMDVVAVREAATWAIETARSGSPVFLDCRCYRFFGHHTAERTMNLGYRTDEEIDTWRLRDPLTVVADALRALTPSADELLVARDATVEARIAEGLEFARSSPRPEPSTATDYAYASPIAGMPRGVLA